MAELLERCKIYDEGFGSIVLTGAFLDRFYIPTRYPNSLPGGIPANVYREKDCSEVIKLAEKVLQFISRKLAAK
ncbi:MAG: HEPN domain-containing protein [Proteobacteria bacterium]|nr:HEPN domain-containing protein [Pseudomonadota bacterium]